MLEACYPAPDRIDLPEDDDARIERDPEHRRDDGAADRKGAWPWTEQRHGGHSDQQERARAVGQIVKARQHDAKQLAGKGPSDVGRAGLQHLERRRRHKRTEHDHAAQPDDQREHVHVPQRPHLVECIN